jgi:bifunctional polynucleotide phosphatase/kinase
MSKKPRAIKPKPVVEEKTLVKPLIKPPSKRPIIWSQFPNYILGHTTQELPDFTNAKIAAFDLDDTLIKCENKFAKDENDWQIFDQSVPTKLKSYVDSNYKLVIVTNQKGISTKKTDPEMWKNKLGNVVDLINLDVTILCCTSDDCYRKPGTALWSTYIKGFDINNSFYCGDAGGLPVRTINKIKLKKDFADTDLKFALNLQIKFIHRDEFIYDIVNSFKYNINYPNTKSYCKPSPYKFIPSDSQEMILLCGFPASGKSYFSKQLNDKYVVVNQDTLKTQTKCIQTAEKALSEGKSVVIDNTSVSKEKRLVYISIAKKYSIPIRCVHLTCPIDLCKHNSYYRNFVSGTDIIPTIAYNIMGSKYEEPDMAEGFVSIDKVDFCFGDEDTVNYCKYYF